MKNLVKLLFLLVFNFSFTNGLHPVILVPGDGGSQLDAKLNKSSSVHYLCDKTTNDYFNIWLNLELLAPLVIDCWVDNVRLVYNVTTRKTENSPGVDIRVPGFGNTSTVEFLDPSKSSSGFYFKYIVESALIPLGYERNSTIRGAPYDFRKAPNEMEGWMRDFKELIEHSYESNGKSSVVFICHSMGAPLSLYFLQQQTQSWKNKYVKALVTLAGVWGGSVKALKAFAKGDDLGAYFLPSHKMRGEQRTSPSTAWLLPSKFFWEEDEILVTTPKRNYTRMDYKHLFYDMDLPLGYEMFKDTENLLKNLEHPGVETHCLHGTGVSTVEKMNYTSLSYFPGKPTLVNGNGDGTVNIRSLRGCTLWPKQANKLSKQKSTSVKITKKDKLKLEAVYRNKIYHEEFSGVDHMHILSDQRVLNYVKNVVQKINEG